MGDLLGDAIGMLAIGLVAGIGLALLAGREVSSVVFGLGPWDPAVLVGAGSILACVTIAASLIPAWRAAKLNPADSLRTESPNESQRVILSCAGGRTELSSSVSRRVRTGQRAWASTRYTVRSWVRL